MKTTHGILAFVLAAATLQGQQPRIEWEADYEQALAKARQEGKAVLVAFVMDDEPANDEVVKQHYVDPEVVRLSQRMVCLVGNIGNHGTGECPKFGGITCAQHQAVEKKARAALLKTDVVRSPQHVFLSKTGAELFRRVYLIAKQELRKVMAVACASHSADGSKDPIASEEQHRVDRLLKEADSRNAEVRDAAFAGLATADDSRAIPSLIERVRRGDDEGARHAAIKALGVKGNHAAIRPLVGFLGDKSTRLYVAAVRALATIELPEAVPELMAMLKKERNERNRGWLLRAMARCLPESPEVQKLCIQGLKGTGVQQTEMALVAAFSLKPDPKIAEAVKPLLSSKRENTRALAAWVLGRQCDKTLTPLLERMAREDKSPDVKQLAAKAIAQARGDKLSDYDHAGSRFCSDEDF